MALLCYLVATGQVQSRDRLAGFLWPDVPQRNALASLRTALYEVRRALGGSAVEILQVDRNRLGIRAAADVRLDTSIVEAAARSADEPSIDALERAVGSYGGDFLSGLSLPDACDFDDWAFVERERLVECHLANLCRLSELYATRRDHARAIEALRRVLAVDPLREDVHRALMRDYALSGQRPAALSAYRDLVALLDRELGIAPLDATTELYESIVANAPLEEDGGGPPPVARAAARVAAARGDELAAPAGPRLVGRLEELEALRRAWAQAAEGRSGVVTISGEAGIGKSRLLADLVAQIEAAGTMFVGRCYEATSGEAYAPVVAALRHGLAGRDVAQLGLSALWLGELARLLPELGSEAGQTPNVALEIPRQRDRLFDAVCEALVACTASGPVALIVDDCQWADETSLSLLGYAARRLQGSALLLVLAYRSEEVDPSRRALLRSIEGLGRRLALGPLGVAETAELVADLADAAEPPARFARRLQRSTGGNPLFVIETLRALLDQGTLVAEPEGWTALAGLEDGEYVDLPIPESVGAVIDARLDRLTDDARCLLEAAAILRRDFAFELAQRLSGLPLRAALDSLDALLGLGILREQPTGATGGLSQYDFAHAVLRDRVYRSLSGARRQYLHRQVAGLIENAADAPPERVAYHYLRGGARERALDWSLRAGDTALGVYAGESALGHYRTARELASCPGDEMRALRGMGDACISLGRPREATICFEQALALPADTDDRADLLRRVGRAQERQGAYDRALAAYASALELVRGCHSMASLRVVDGLATVYVRLGRHAQAVGLCLEALAWLAENPGVEGSTEGEAWIRNTLGMAYLDDGDFPRAERALRRSLELKRSMADRQGEATLLNNLGALYYRCGDDDQARSFYSGSLHIKEEVGDGYGQAIALTNLALIETHAGQHDRAWDHLRRAEKVAGDVGARWLMPEIRRVDAQRALATGDVTAALASAEAALAAAEDLGVPAFIGVAHRILGQVKSSGAGDPGAAREHFETSVAVFEMLENDHELAKTHAAYGQALRATGEKAVALDHLRRAADVFERSGAYGRRERLEPLLGD